MKRTTVRGHRADADARTAGGAPDRAAWFEDVTARAGVKRPHVNRRFENPYAAHHGRLHGARRVGVGCGLQRRRTRRPVRDRFFGRWHESSLSQQRRLDFHRRRGRGRASPTATIGRMPRPTRSGSTTTATRRPDLFVVRFGRSQLFRNLGNGRFTDVTAKVGPGPLPQRDYGDRLRLRPRRRSRSVGRQLLPARSTSSIPTRRASSPRASRPRTTAAASRCSATTAAGRSRDVTKRAGLVSRRLGARRRTCRRRQRRRRGPLRGGRLRHRSLLREQRRRHVPRSHGDGHRHRYQEGDECRVGGLRRRPAA